MERIWQEVDSGDRSDVQVNAYQLALQRKKNLAPQPPFVAFVRCKFLWCKCSHGLFKATNNLFALKNSRKCNNQHNLGLGGCQYLHTF